MGRVQFPTKQPMPGNVRAALEKRSLMEAYLARPAYQKDDYLKWIASAAGPLAKQQRLEQMLGELEKGGVYKGEPWTPPEPVAPASKPAAEPPSKPAAALPSKPAATPAKKPAAAAPKKPAVAAPKKPGK